MGCSAGVIGPLDGLATGRNRKGRLGMPSSKRKRVPKGLSVVQGFVENVEFDQTFDVITCYAIVEHLQEPIMFLMKLYLNINLCKMKLSLPASKIQENLLENFAAMKSSFTA